MMFTSQRNWDEIDTLLFYFFFTFLPFLLWDLMWFTYLHNLKNREVSVTDFVESISTKYQKYEEMETSHWANTVIVRVMHILGLSNIFIFDALRITFTCRHSAILCLQRHCTRTNKVTLQPGKNPASDHGLWAYNYEMGGTTLWAYHTFELLVHMSENIALRPGFSSSISLAKATEDF